MAKRKLYLSDPKKPVPKTTAWRLAIKNLESSCDCDTPKRRKGYYRNACPVPKSTLWKWKKKTDDRENDDDTEDAEWGCDDHGGDSDGDHYDGHEEDEQEEENEDEQEEDRQEEEDEQEEDRQQRGNQQDEDHQGGGYNEHDHEEDSQHSEDDDGGGEDSDSECSVGNGFFSWSSGESENDDNGVGGAEGLDSSEQNDRIDSNSFQESSAHSSSVGSRRQPLYKDAPITVEESMYTTYLYAVKNKLSYQATSQLLDLMKLHFPSPNSYPQSIHSLKKHIAVMSSVKVTHYCSTCLKEIPQQQNICSSVGCSGQNFSHYALLPFEDHLREIYSDKWEQLQYPFTRQTIPDTLQDVQDGKVYQRLQKPGGFLSVPENTGLILCSDGVQLFKSSNQSFWPILLAVTSLPPGIRMNAENLILAGVWQGPVKPPMKIILGQVLDKIHHLCQVGIPVTSPHFNGVKIIRVKLLMGVFDLPARASAVNCNQFNGNYSCLYCLDKGRHVANRHLFLPEEDHEPRTQDSIKEHAVQAEQSGNVVFGVKGISILSSHIDIVKTVPVDYMHAILEGVSKRLLSVCLDTKKHMYRFYLGRATKVIDERLKQIKPPHEFRRSPRSVTSMKQWKASEFRAWILYYCLPVLSGILPADYIYHLSLLVSAMHILLGDAIPKGDINKAHKLLVLFYRLTPQLYSEDICTANIHLLIHLSDCVQNLGPLWGYSCFGFESMNGHLRKSCHGTRYVLPQLIHTVRMRQMLPVRGKEIARHADSNTAAFIHSLADIKVKTSEVEIKSRITHKKLKENVIRALKSAAFLDSNDPAINFPVCERIRYKSITYSTAPKKQRCRDGSVCVFSLRSELQFGSIHQFCFCNGNLVVVINRFECDDRSIFDIIYPSTHRELTKVSCKTISEFIHNVKPLTNTLVAVPVSSLYVKCVHVHISGSQSDFVITIPNMYEHH